MQPHQERVVSEKDELYTKIEKLSSFIGGDVYSTLDEAEQYRLSRQLTYMQQYSEVLGERIDAF
jgi:hypothetical protein